MGKKVKKRTRAPPKEKRVVVHSPKNSRQQPSVSDGTVQDVVEVVNERKPCVHLQKEVDLEKLSVKIGSSEPIRCEDCREGGNERRGSKGKSKQGKKKGSASLDSKSESKAIWVCLQCGHYACGGVGLPTGAQSHVVRHVRSTRHHLVIQWENPQLCWCFPCNLLLPVEKTEENSEKEDTLAGVAKLIKARSIERSSVDVEEVWFGGGSVTSEVKLEGTVSGSVTGGGGYVARGLVNLGNTCFFNSVMQNLFALDRLRKFFLNEDMSAGPLSISLKKLFSETKPEAGLKNVINPRSFFGSICSKAPQFRGYQQHDSHELLRCLLDGLSAEELGLRKKSGASDTNLNSSNGDSTFVDAVFGGQISSTVCCVECGHSSTVYEPFLDLSLSVPTKKPLTKKAQTVARAKKTKLPPKSSGKIQSKHKKDAPGKTISNPSASSGSPDQGHSTEPLTAKVSSADDSAESGSIGSIIEPNVSDPVSQNSSVVPVSNNDQALRDTTQQKAAPIDDFTWLDYLEPGTMSDENDSTSTNNDIYVLHDSSSKDMAVNDVLTESSEVSLVGGEPHLKSSSSSGNLRKEDLPLQVQDSEVLLLPYKEESSAIIQVMAGDDEASSSAVGCGQDASDFDGFGDLFNEPEIAEGPITGPSLGPEVAGTGFTASNSSESDPEEVDNSDSPVSVDSCLGHFIKPELLTNDNAWICENCSKSLQHQRLEEKKVKRALKNLTSGGETRSKIDPGQLDTEVCSPSEVGSRCNGDIIIDSGNSVSNNGKIAFSDQTCINLDNGQTGEHNPVYSTCKEKKGEIQYAPKHSHSSGFPESASHSCGVDDPFIDSGKPTHKTHQSNSPLLDENYGSEDSEDEEISLKNVKVKRDATKRVLINKAPPVLTIHLKRFSQDARGRLSKLNGHVNFREMIDLLPYMDPRCVDMEKYAYRLVGVVEHLGTMRGGHYVAYVRGEKLDDGVAVWYHVSDAYVRQASLEEVLRCEAYILFYEKV